MGALHAGHTSLFDAAKRNGELVVATIFVNPRQFNDAADLRAYPRTPGADAALAAAHGVDCLVEPTLDAMWPQDPTSPPSRVWVGGISESLVGGGRPGHFEGVASVVAKLLAITGQCRAYFGEKDFQQLAVVRQMVHDLGFDVEVVGSAIVRDHDGLALSSRNVLLAPPQRTSALGLSRALRAAEALAAPASIVRETMLTILEDSGLDVAYAEVVDPITFEASSDYESGERRALVAARVGGVRLIDNATVTLMAKGD